MIFFFRKTGRYILRLFPRFPIFLIVSRHFFLKAARTMYLHRLGRPSKDSKPCSEVVLHGTVKSTILKYSELMDYLGAQNNKISPSFAFPEDKKSNSNLAFTMTPLKSHLPNSVMEASRGRCSHGVNALLHL